MLVDIEGEHTQFDFKTCFSLSQDLGIFYAPKLFTIAHDYKKSHFYIFLDSSSLFLCVGQIHTKQKMPTTYAVLSNA